MFILFIYKRVALITVNYEWQLHASLFSAIVVVSLGASIAVFCENVVGVSWIDEALAIIYVC